jgi:hypothetical protein
MKILNKDYWNPCIIECYFDPNDKKRIAEHERLHVEFLMMRGKLTKEEEAL